MIGLLALALDEAQKDRSMLCWFMVVSLTSRYVKPLMGTSPLLQISSSVTPKLHWSAVFPMGAPL